MIVKIRHAKIEDAHVIAEAEREIAKKPSYFCSQPSELTDENVINTISNFIKNKTGIYIVAEYDNENSARRCSGFAKKIKKGVYFLYNSI
jgi:hypothetical protein